jgi:hypothetical protein
MGLFVVLYPLFSIQVPPTPSPPPESYTWRVNPGCTNATAAAADVQFLSTLISLTPYVHGCGSWGDGVEAYERRQFNGGSTMANLAFDVLFPLWMMMALVIGMPLVFASMHIYLHLMPLDQFASSRTVELHKERLPGQMRVFGKAILGIYAICLIMGACFILFEAKVYDRTWLCRSYITTTSPFGEIDSVYVVNASPDRGSSEITSPSIWAQVEDVARRCPNLNLHYGSSSRSFSIAFEASDEVNHEIDSAITKAWKHLLIYGVCVIGLSLTIVMVFGFILTMEQKAQLWNRFCVRSAVKQDNLHVPVPVAPPVRVVLPPPTVSPVPPVAIVPSASPLSRDPSWLHAPLAAEVPPPYAPSSSFVQHGKGW